jgi:hypothetical protein
LKNDSSKIKNNKYVIYCSWRFNFNILLIGARYTNSTIRGKTKTNHFKQFLSRKNEECLSLPIKYTMPAGSPSHIIDAITCPNVRKIVKIP